MELLLSNYPPMKTKCRTFSDMFYSMVPKSTELDIAVGYITSDSLMELQRIKYGGKAMSISGINNYNYPNYYAGARHNMAKTGGRDSGVLSSTSSASSNISG